MYLNDLRNNNNTINNLINNHTNNSTNNLPINLLNSTSQVSLMLVGLKLEFAYRNVPKLNINNSIILVISNNLRNDHE
uniref:Uncharacterized protein n=1 Tax=Meloidogyne incognita TaxID=6306 RepID=A0A914LSH7_MELIC